MLLVDSQWREKHAHFSLNNCGDDAKLTSSQVTDITIWDIQNVGLHPLMDAKKFVVDCTKAVSLRGLRNFGGRIIYNVAW